MIRLILLLLMCWLMAMCSCSKSDIIPPCAKCSLVSYKYNSKWELKETSTLWQDNNICGIELGKVISAKQVDTLGKINCPEILPGIQFEIRKYFIN